MDLNFEICTMEDLGILTDISRATFVTAFEKHNKPEDFWTYINNSFSEETIIEQLLDINSSFYFVYLKNVLVGYFKINKNEAQTEQFAKNTVELERIYVIKPFQGQGIGKHILKKVISLAKKAKANFLWLGVWEKNKAAIKFYKRYGFKKFGTHPYFVGKDEQTDWLMKLNLV